ncbi:hypothetical protein P2318_33620 [Myxococcaceae bacterium GXIMD 01537]
MKSTKGWARSACRLFLTAGALVAGAASAQENPMNAVGEQHNGMLACLMAEDPSNKENPFAVLVERCGFKPETSNEEFIETYSQLVPENLGAPLSQVLKPYRGHFNDIQFSYLLKVDSILASQDPQRAAESLARLEADAVKTLGREPSDLAVLSGLSTARYSTCIWGDGGCTPSWPFPWPRPKPRWPDYGGFEKQAKAKWWQVVLGDVAGGIVGGIFGGGVGAVGLGAACSKAVASL